MYYQSSLEFELLRSVSPIPSLLRWVWGYRQFIPRLRTMGIRDQSYTIWTMSLSRSI